MIILLVGAILLKMKYSKVKYVLSDCRELTDFHYFLVGYYQFCSQYANHPRTTSSKHKSTGGKMVRNLFAQTFIKAKESLLTNIVFFFYYM